MESAVIGLNMVGLFSSLGWFFDEDEEFPVFAEPYGRNRELIGDSDSFKVKGENYLRDYE